ncbi:Myb/SANT-like domain-containing protein [Rhynchospora pubera]|uniref:Myb/SANT-like domain-containing protein n=1 Tax=Rhynchospora pubera TaxID=906938 RepID=A0AAV8FXS2_9POAL|nr:Myb/SANT-like domain-containing protein [Rhynchospora pubera]
MELNRNGKSRNKGKETNMQEKKTTKRGNNWGEYETTALLEATEEFQIKKGKSGFGFTKTDIQEIKKVFADKMKGTSRTKENIANRLKRLKHEFQVLHSLAEQSGWGWNNAAGKPNYPSEEEWIAATLTKGEDAKWVRNKEFPWYRKMETMFGGRSARGERLKETYTSDLPSNEAPLTEGSVLGSEQGSSDDPKEFPTDDDCYESVRQEHCRAGTCYQQGGQSSDGTFPVSGSSGSKRKSTDERSEDKSRGKTYRENSRRRQK